MPYLLLLRHGQSQFNQDSKFCGWINAPLTEKGEEQASNTALMIESHSLTRDIPLHLCVTSRLQRAVETSNIILQKMDRLDMDVIKTWRLNERHYGSFQGKRKNEVLQEYGQEQYMYIRRAYNGCPPECDVTSDAYRDTLKIARFDNELKTHPELVPRCESLKMVIERLDPFWRNEILSTIKRNENVLCVTHGSVVRAMLKILYELTEDEVEHLNIPNGMPILIEIDAKTLKPVGKQWTYLEPEKARLEAERVKLEGMNH